MDSVQHLIFTENDATQSARGTAFGQESLEVGRFSTNLGAMESLVLHELHEAEGARFIAVDGSEVVADYGDAPAEHAALTQSLGVLDLSFRGRLCLTGTDRVRFLHGQVTNDVKAMQTGQGCYAALITAKGRMQSDLHIYALADELLLDFEPGLTTTLSHRLEHYVIADDVQVVDVAPHFGLLSVQGPRAAEAVRGLRLAAELPEKPYDFVKVAEAARGEIYVMNQPRLGTSGFDLFVPTAALRAVAEELNNAAKPLGGRTCGWQAFETARIEAGLPRFGPDMDDTNLPLEAGLETRAISFAKGCYIGQEVISRIQTYGQVTKALRRLRLADGLTGLPVKGDRLFSAGKEVGYITSAVVSPTLKANIALGYVRKETNQVGTALTLRTAAGESPVTVTGLPFAVATA